MDVESINPRDWATAQSRGEILSRMPARPSGAQFAMRWGSRGQQGDAFRWLKNFAVPRRLRNYARVSQISQHFRLINCESNSKDAHPLSTDTHYM